METPQEILNTYISQAARYGSAPELADEVLCSDEPSQFILIRKDAYLAVHIG